MEGIRKQIIADYIGKINKASKELNKKEHFKDLLHRIYPSDVKTQKIIDKISAGSEASVLNIPRKDRLHRGSADSLFNKVIIEFENDLRKTGEHAKEQLAGYLLGQFNAGEGYNFTLIATDCLVWKVYSPDISQLDQLDKLKEHELILNEDKDSTFILTEKNAEEFYHWIDRFLFKEEKVRATLKRIEDAFGHKSSTFIECYRQLSAVFKDAKLHGEVQVSYEQWRKFLSIAYGSFNDTESAFVIHTYLSMLAKVLAYEVLSNDDFIDDEEMKSILNGSIFHQHNIRNFVDNDFYHWVHGENHYTQLKKTFRLITQEMSNFDFNKVDEDILKGVYQELIDLDTRHALGEYYTPDWLCERVVSEFNFKTSDKILDPSCGSGSFLRASIHRLRELNPKITSEQISNCIYGIDIHPLSVQIAKTTVLIGLGKEVVNSKKPIHINVILANTLLTPEGEQNLFGGEFTMHIDKDKYVMNTQLLEDVKLFDDALEACEELAEQTKNVKIATISTFENVLKKQYNASGLNTILLDGYYQIYLGLKKVKESGRDSIWKFILQNMYKPYFLANKFDYIVGNPPWFTLSSIKNEDYQITLETLAVKYNLKPDKVADYPHLEIAAIFLAHCSNYFLKKDGKLAFVLPRSFFSGSQHDKTRSGIAKGFKLSSIWDLNDVSPLFRIPSCVLFSENSKDSKSKVFPANGLEGRTFTATLPAHNCNIKSVESRLIENETVWYYSQQGKATAFTEAKRKSTNKINPYKKLFKQGATIVPRTFYFIELTQEMPPDFEDRIINITTSDAVQTDAKAPWKGLKFNGKIESQFVFRTALSKSILPFALYKPDLVVLPLMIESDTERGKKIMIQKADNLMKSGFIYASKWFSQTEETWDTFKTEKSKNMLANDRINFQRGITDQDLNAAYVVLYNSSAKDANATVVVREELDLEFIVESVTYVLYTNDIDEAYYLTAILNSATPNEQMKDFQAKGLFGARHVHKKILDIYYPKYDSTNKIQKKLSDLSQAAHQKAKVYLGKNPPKKELTAVVLGKLRSDMKKHLISEMREIDELVKKIIN
jgi:type I restriction-modification system DNA methylase subunit